MAIAGVAVATLATACGSSGGGSVSSGASTGGGSKSSFSTLVAASVDKTLAAKNAKMHLDFSGSAAGKDLTFGGDGVIDFSGKKMQLTLNLPSTAGIGGTIEERLLDGVVYVKYPAVAASALGGKQWIKIDASSLGGAGSSFGSTSQDPSQLLATLRSVSDSVTNAGTTDVRGVKTTHYVAEVSLTKAANVSGVDKTELQKAQEALKTLTGKDTIPENVYIDGGGLVRRFSVSFTPSTSTSSAAAGTFTTTIDFYDYGNADTSSIVAPPADEVGTLPGGASSLGG